MGKVRTDDDLHSAAEIGLQISRLRLQKNLSQEALAEKAGLDRSTLNKIESGRRIPDATVLIALSKELSVSPGELFPQNPACSNHSLSFESKLHSLIEKMNLQKRELFCSFMLQAASAFISDSAV